MPRQVHGESRAGFGGGHHADVPLVGKNNFLRDGEPQAEIRSNARPRIDILPARKGLENGVDLAGRNRVALIMRK
jgi:hypothetical protein